MKKILIVGEIYSDNLGDGLLCQIVDNKLKDKFETKLFDLSCRKNFISKKEHKEYFSYKNYYEIIIKNKVKKILSAIGINFKSDFIKNEVKKIENELEKLNNSFKPDEIIFAGGQMFQDCFINQINCIINYAEKNNIPVIFNAIGFGNINNDTQKKLNDILNNDIVKYVSIRDYNKNIDNDKLIHTYDTALLASDIFPSATKNKKTGLGIMLSYKFSLQKQIKFWKKIISYYVDNNIDFEIFTNGGFVDYSFASFLINVLNIEKKVLCKRPENPNELIEIITRFDKIISMRLHSLIIAYSFGIPALAVTWDKKVNIFYDKIKRSNMCLNLDYNEVLNSLYLLDNNDFKDNQRNIIKSEINNNFKDMLEKIK